MNILGHAYVAACAVSGNRKFLIIGSLLPESFPFIAINPFTHQEIHEGGEALLRFLDQSFPEKRDLALGMMTHSLKFGVDGWNKEIEKYAGDGQKELLGEIAHCSNVELRIAEYRLHNFLWWGVDWWILKKNPKFANEVAQILITINIGEVSRLLTECFGKDYQKTQKTVKALFKEIYQPGDLNSVEGLAKIWARQAAGLPEHDRVDVKRAAKIIEKAADLIKDDWEEFLEFTVRQVRENLKPFLIEVEREV